MPYFGRSVVAASFVAIFATSLVAQQGTAPAPQVPPTPPPPATKLEGFKPASGSVVTVGYDDLGRIAGIYVEAREMRDTKGGGARGLLVQVTQGEHGEEQAFVDADEIPELLKGLDALLEVKANPTQFKMFEVRYSTRGDLQLTAFSSRKGAVLYAVEAGRTLKAQRFIDAGDMLKLRGLFDAALQKLDSTSSK